MLPQDPPNSYHDYLHKNQILNSQLKYDEAAIASLGPRFKPEWAG